MNIKTIVIISIHADPSEPPGVGGGGGTHVYIRELMSGLALRGRYSAFITRRSSSSLPQRERITRRAELFRINIGPIGPLDKRKLNDYHEETKQKIRKILNLLDPPPGLLHSVYWNSGRVAMDLSKEFYLNYVHTVISNGLRRRLEGATGEAKNRVEIEHRVFSNAFRIFSVSNSEKRDLIELYGVDPKHIIVVGRPVNNVFLDPAHDELGNPHRISYKTLNRGCN